MQPLARAKFFFAVGAAASNLAAFERSRVGPPCSFCLHPSSPPSGSRSCRGKAYIGPATPTLTFLLSRNSNLLNPAGCLPPGKALATCIYRLRARIIRYASDTAIFRDHCLMPRAVQAGSRFLVRGGFTTVSMGRGFKSTKRSRPM